MEKRVVTKPFRNSLLVWIGSVAIIWYYVAIICIATNFIGQENSTQSEFRQFMSLSITTVSGTLATFVGMYLGFQARREVVKNTQVQQVISQSRFQALASLAYLISIILAIAFWGYQTWRGETIDPVLQNLAKSLLGLIVGSLAVLLNTGDSEEE